MGIDIGAADSFRCSSGWGACEKNDTDNIKRGCYN